MIENPTGEMADAARTPNSPETARVVAALRAAGCVFAEDEAEILLAAAASGTDLDSMVEARVAGLPLEQIVGWAAFAGLRIAVGPGVFVPRRRTEVLVRLAIELARGVRHTGRTPVVLDLCCGSGALGAAVAAALDRIELHASDIEPAAVACARRNIPLRDGFVYQGDLFEPLPDSLRGRIDVLVANVPYVPTEEIPLLPTEARLYEPVVALDGGSDGLDIARRIAAEARQWLRPGGRMLIETSELQIPAATDVMTAAGLSPHVVTDDDIGATVVIGATAIPSREPTR